METAGHVTMITNQTQGLDAIAASKVAGSLIFLQAKKRAKAVLLEDYRLKRFSEVSDEDNRRNEYRDTSLKITDF